MSSSVKKSKVTQRKLVFPTFETAEPATAQGFEDRSSNSGSPDIVSFGRNRGGWSETVDRLENSYDVENVQISDLELGEEGEIKIGGLSPGELEDSLLRIRPSSFFSNIEEDYQKMNEDYRDFIGEISNAYGFGELELFENHIWNSIQSLEKDHGLEFIGRTGPKRVMENKRATKRFYDSLGVETPGSYSVEEAYRKARNGEKIIAKPQDRNQGEGVSLVEPDGKGEAINDYLEDVLGENYSLEEIERNVEFEEYIDITDPETAEKRMYFAGSEVFVAGREHPEIEAGWRPQNSHQGGDYVQEVKPSEMSNGEKRIYQAGIRMGGIHAIDYIETGDGRTVLLEDNGNPGHGISDALDVDLGKVEVDYISTVLESRD
ncbi:MAG: glutathione synthase/RimK-type ligase-like ATP-grasp enzyme [Candidatus Nanohaloarchaea archaeon]|jgi:glutathione synthase/RimK-type ligase-like ATP-grasp enzyme